MENVSFTLDKDTLERLNNELENQSKSQFVRRAIKNQLANDKVKNIDLEQVIKNIESKAKKQSSEQVDNDFSSPEHYQAKINETRDQLENLENQLAEKKRALDNSLADLAVSDNENKKEELKSDIKDLKHQRDQLQDKIEDKKNMINALQGYKEKAEKSHKRRTKLQGEIEARKLKNQVYKPALEKLNQSYREFKSMFILAQELYGLITNKHPELNSQKLNTLKAESKLGLDLDIDTPIRTGVFANSNSGHIKDMDFSNTLPNPDLERFNENETEQETEQEKVKV